MRGCTSKSHKVLFSLLSFSFDFPLWAMSESDFSCSLLCFISKVTSIKRKKHECLHLPKNCLFPPTITCLTIPFARHILYLSLYLFLILLKSVLNYGKSPSIPYVYQLSCPSPSSMHIHFSKLGLLPKIALCFETQALGRLHPVCQKATLRTHKRLHSKYWEK